MGLLGGFKGKLIGKARKEKKSSGTGHVVCVKFNTFSEFEPGPSTSTSNGNWGRNDVVRERRPPTKPEIKGVFERMANGGAGAAQQPKAPTSATTNVTAPKKATAPTKPTTNATAATKSPTKAASATKPPTKTTAPTKPTTNTISSTKSTAAPDPPKSQAPKIPQPVPVEKPVTPTPVVTTKTIQFPLVPSDDDDDDDDDGNFQIHFAKTVNHKFGDSSDEDSLGGHYVDAPPMNFSSQATSIFFGGEEEPNFGRPRNVAVNDDDGDTTDGSSASA